MSENPVFQWYRFWRTWKGSEPTDTYRRYEENISEDFLEDDCMDWAEQQHASEYFRYRFDKVDRPPVEWLEKALKDAERYLEYAIGRVDMLAAELKSAQNEDQDE